MLPEAGENFRIGYFFQNFGFLALFAGEKTGKLTLSEHRGTAELVEIHPDCLDCRLPYIFVSSLFVAAGFFAGA